ncbi:ATP-grasp domain-containing protein [Streptomyces sp. NBC_00335]|uniref:carboxylate--amine ligase n=2 Tax=unclassified Streptomyces TaxID=2593676 RepID=UPI0022514FE1|nr:MULTISPECIES: ATP-grasp domain-containing protein [unclassified Streptomyces]MCX5406688.1 ATP-grasp domain-containing protein [Streptomyces sp. NBC_00086]
MHAHPSQVPAVLLRLDRNPFHHGTLGAVRSLGRTGVEVHAVVEAGGGPMGRSRYLRAVHPGPSGGVDPEAPEALLECLTGVSERIGRPAVLIAMDDLSAIAVSRVGPMLTDRFRIPHQPDDLPARVADKAELSRLCARWDVPHPETVIPASGAEAAEAAWRLGLPVIAKWSRPWLLPQGTGLRSTTLLHAAAEARRLYERSAEAGSRLLLQRFLPAGPDTDWFFHGAFARGGRPLITGSGRKELSWPVRTGLTAVGRWLPDPAVEEAGLRLAERLGYQGILDLDFRRDERGVFRLVDFNPRPGAQFRLFTDAGGLDVVQAMYLDLTGQRVPEPSGGPGRVFVAENYALLAAVRGRSLPRRPPAPPAGGGAGTGAAPGRSVRTAAAAPARRGRERGRVEAAWFAADDPMPFLAMLAAFLGRGAVKGLRVLRGVPAQGRRTARAVVRAPRQRGREVPPPAAAGTSGATGPRSAPPEAPAEPDELVTR